MNTSATMAASNNKAMMVNCQTGPHSPILIAPLAQPRIYQAINEGVSTAQPQPCVWSNPGSLDWGSGSSDLTKPLPEPQKGHLDCIASTRLSLPHCKHS